MPLVKEDIKKIFHADDNNFLFQSTQKKPRSFKTLQILLRHCIFPHNPKLAKSRKKVEHVFHKDVNGFKIKSYLYVEADKGGFVTPFDRDLLYTLHLYAQKLLFSETYIFVLEATEIFRLLGIQNAGHAYQRIKESLNRLMSLTITTNMLFPQEDRVDDTLFARFKLVSGYIYEKGNFYVDLSSFAKYLAPRHIKHVSYDNYMDLKSNLAKHVYGMLKVFFEGDNKKKFTIKTHNFLRYCLLDNYFSLPKKEYNRNLKRTVIPALEEIKDKGYFKFAFKGDNIEFISLNNN